MDLKKLADTIAQDVGKKYAEKAMHCPRELVAEAITAAVKEAIYRYESAQTRDAVLW